MIIRKTITTISATLISVTLLCMVLFEERINTDLVSTILFTSFLLLPIILLYGVPVTFLSDYLSKRWTGVKRVLIAMVFHLFFGLLIGLLDGSSEFLIGATTCAFFFWVIDEMLRYFFQKSAVMNHHEADTVKVKFWSISFIVLFVLILLALILGTFMEAKKATNLNWDGIIPFHILYALGFALLFSPIGYLVIKTIYFRKKYCS